MTRKSQKEEETIIANRLIAAEGIRVDKLDCSKENPDVTLHVNDALCGLELTTYTFDQKQRSNEARWERLRNETTKLGATGALGKVWITLCFGHNAVPKRDEIPAFLNELSKLCDRHPPTSATQDDEHWDFSAYPRLRRHLCSLQLRQVDHPINFYLSSDVQAGYVPHPDARVAEIIEEKTKKSYHADLSELWLAIYSGLTVAGQIAELPSGSSGEGEWEATILVFEKSKFDRIYLIDHGNIVRLDHSRKWANLAKPV